MIDPRKLINQKLTDEDMSLLFLSGDALMFNSKEQFETWFFILNFPLLKKYLKLDSDSVNPDSQVAVSFDLPFDISFTDDARLKYGESNGLDLLVTVNREKERYDLATVRVNMSRPEARMLLRACR
tara:strand:- start:931 stop:1308 length:378 start_codon:yes stop_codon:yes gene_type:complete